MPRKPLDNERKAWQAYSAGQTIGLPMLPFTTPSEARCQADRGINAFVLSLFAAFRVAFLVTSASNSGVRITLGVHKWIRSYVEALFTKYGIQVDYDALGVLPEEEDYRRFTWAQQLKLLYWAKTLCRGVWLFMTNPKSWF